MALLGGVSAIAIMMPTSQPMAACAPAAGPGTPPPGTTVTCTGATGNQNGTSGYGDGSQNGLTINVQPGAALSGQTFGINVNANNSVNNSGAISASVSHGIFAGAGTLSVTNFGTITGGGALGTGGIDGSTVNVTNQGTISGSGGIFTNNGGSTIANSGTISSRTNFPAIIFTGQNNALTNNQAAVINGAVSSSTSSTDSITINNAGTINSSGGAGALGTIGVTQATITNSGTITADGSNRFAILMTAGSVDNSRTITSSQGIALQSFGGVTVTNSGMISGTTAITTGGPANITNSGTITGTGGTAIRFASSQPNSLTLTPTSVINGNVLGTPGSDTLSLGGTGTGSFDVSSIGPSAQFRDFDAFTKSGTSTWNLTGTGAQNWTISQGTLVGDTNSLQGGQITNNASLTFNQAFTGTYAGVISGTGTVTKDGAGVATFSGNSTYTGATTIAAGTLIVNGSLVSPVSIASGATLGGSGSVGGIAAPAGSIVAPGNSIGQLNVNGNVAFSAGSTYQVEANAAGQADKVVATGTATLGGGTVQVLAANGTYAPRTTYDILHANAGVSGGFDGATSNLAFLTASLSYGVNDVFLTLARNTTSFATVAQTVNQRAVAAALDASPFGSALVQAVLPLTAPQALQAFEALSGEIHASVVGALTEDSRYMRQAVLGRLRTASYASDAGALANLSIGGPQVAFQAEAEQGGDATLAYDAKNQLPVKARPPAPAAGPDVAVWGQSFGAWGRWDGDGNASRLDRDLAGVIAGADMRFAEGWRGGFAAGYTHADVSVPALASSADVDSFHLAGYLGTRFGAWSVRGGAAFAWHDIDTLRAIVFPGFFDQARARQDSTTAQVFGEVGYGITWGGAAFEPFAGLAWVNVDTNGFLEGGGPAALLGTGASLDTGYSTLGARAATTMPLANGMVLIPRASAAWQHAFNDGTPAARAAFVATGSAFALAGVPIARDSALVEAGLELAVSRNATVGVSYVGQLSDTVQDHAVKGKAVWRF